MSPDRKPISLLLVLLLCVAVTGVAIGYFLLPAFIEKTARQSVLQKTPFVDFSADVGHAGLFSTDIDDIVIGDESQPALSIGSINITYSPVGLLKKEIKQVDINGLTIYLVLNNGKLSVPGFDNTVLQPKEETAPTAINIPVELDSVKIRNGILDLDNDGYRILIPFELNLSQKDQGDSQFYTTTLHIYPRGEKLTASADLDLTENRLAVKMFSDRLQLDKFADQISKISGMSISGQATINAQSEIDLQTMEIVSVNMDAQLQPFSVDIGSIMLGSPQNDQGENPLTLSLAGNDQNLQYTLKNATISGPLNSAVEVEGSMELNHGALNGSGEFAVQVSEIPSVILNESVKLVGVTNYGYDTSTGNWHISIEQGKEPVTAKKKIKLQYQDIAIDAAYPQFSLSGQGDKKSGKISFSTSLGAIDLNQAGLSGKLGLSLDGRAEMLSGAAGEPSQFKAAGFLKLQNGIVQDKKSAVTVKNISAKIPWQWPAPSVPVQGNFAIPDMRWQKNDLGNITGDITQNKTGYLMDGSYTSKLLKGLVMDINAGASISDAGFTADMQIQTAADNFTSGNLGRINASLDDAYLSGKLNIEGSFTLDSKGTQGNLQMVMQDGVLEFTESEYVIDGLGLSVRLPSLPELRSSPAQQFHFNKATIGNLSITDGRVAWQLESADTLFIEESAFQWAGGKIYANGVRLSPADEKLYIPLFCDRLKLTEILQQFGIANAEGEGTVSGRIPLELYKNTIEFSDGFLYSSPGQGGSVKVAAFDLLTAGIPKNSPQFAQIDFAAEALKNFRYNWVKLFLETTGEDLVMQMQMDGKPYKSLPFAYNSQTGTLSRLKDKGTGIDHPIRLDVNFRFPLNRFLGYSGKIQDLMKKIQ